jgi:HTH-type transcriptional regulator/antitoxin HipB
VVSSFGDIRTKSAIVDFDGLSSFDDFSMMSPFADKSPGGNRMRIRTVPELGLIIRERRRKLGLGQRALAAKVGVSRQWVVEVEQGKARAAVGLVLRTLEALGLQVEIEAAGGAVPTPSPPIVEIDLDAVIDKARGGRR